jgi:hypothetical protein
MDQENFQTTNTQPSQSSHLVPILVSVILTALIVGGGIYLWQDMKFNKEISELQQTIGKLNEKIISLGETPKVIETNNGGTGIKEKVAGDYQWENAAPQSQYPNALWNKITTHKLAGFSPKISLTEKKTEGCGGRGDGSYLRTEGGLCEVGYWLEDSNGAKIDSKEKLASRFAPIENEAEAVSFIAVTQPDLMIDTTGIPSGHTLTTSDGFLVQLVYKNTFGCGTHEPTGIIFKISNNGELQRIASEKQKPPKPGEPVLCVD